MKTLTLFMMLSFPLSQLILCRDIYVSSECVIYIKAPGLGN